MMLKIDTKGIMAIIQVKSLRVKGVPNTEKNKLFNDQETKKEYCVLRK